MISCLVASALPAHNAAIDLVHAVVTRGIYVVQVHGFRMAAD